MRRLNREKNIRNSLNPYITAGVHELFGPVAQSGRGQRRLPTYSAGLFEELFPLEGEAFKRRFATKRINHLAPA
jgi:hypothetical protein